MAAAVFLTLAAGAAYAEENDSASAEHDFPVTFSAGPATFLNPPETAEEMIQKVDALMYDVKKSTKNDIRHREC